MKPTKNAYFDEAIARVNGECVLVCPLNWGMGHATRCVPIVRALVQRGKTVILAADGEGYSFFQREFPQLKLVRFSGINAAYSKRKSQVAAMLWQMPKFLFQIWQEHRKLADLIEQFSVNCVISDNRFGLWNKRVQSIYITHQLMVKMPKDVHWLEPTVWRLHAWFIKHYDICWLPDTPELQLAGDLIHRYELPPNACFIGPLSRFHVPEIPIEEPKQYEVLALISGPEPQRTLFQQDMQKQAISSQKNTLIVCGKPSQNECDIQSQFYTIVSHLSDAELQYYIKTTPQIVCRSGYSTLMDLYALNRKATFVPTPGQTEQEYLCQIHS